MILVLMLCVGQVRSHHREEVGGGEVGGFKAESHQRAVFPHSREMLEKCIFNSADRK